METTKHLTTAEATQKILELSQDKTLFDSVKNEWIKLMVEIIILNTEKETREGLVDNLFKSTK